MVTLDQPLTATANYARPMPDIVSVDEAAAEFKRSRQTIFSWIRQGKIKRYRSEGDMRTLVDRDEIRRLIEPKAE